MNKRQRRAEEQQAAAYVDELVEMQQRVQKVLAYYEPMGNTMVNVRQVVNMLKGDHEHDHEDPEVLQGVLPKELIDEFNARAETGGITGAVHYRQARGEFAGKPADTFVAEELRKRGGDDEPRHGRHRGDA